MLDSTTVNFAMLFLLLSNLFQHLVHFLQVEQPICTDMYILCPNLTLFK